LQQYIQGEALEQIEENEMGVEANESENDTPVYNVFWSSASE
jgi:hypothetical protein